jgi:hypothetical protein
MRLTIFAFLLIIFFSCKNKNSSTIEDKKPTYKIVSLVDSNNVVDKQKKSSEEDKIDTATIAELKKFVNIKKDEYQGRVFYQPKARPTYRNQSGIYCYFSVDTSSSSAGYLRFVFQYYADDWLFIEKYKFVIDSSTYTFIPTKVDRDNGYGGYIWEWSDDLISVSDKPFIEALANAKTAKVRIEGSRYYRDKSITSQQIKSIKVMYELHKAMGGKFY